MDYLVEKLFSFPTKMMGEPSKFSGLSYLMSGDSTLYHQSFPVDLLSGLRGDDIMISETSNQVMPFKQPPGHLTGNNSFNFLNYEKPFSHSSCNLVVDSHRYSHFSFESPFISQKPISHLINSVLINQSFLSLKSISDLHNSSTPAVSESKMSVSQSRSLAKASEIAEKYQNVQNKCTVPSTLMLNKELANRKAKEMLKRSKKRRRRQKKNQHTECSSSASVSDEEVESNVTSSVTSCVCMVSDTSNFGCCNIRSRTMQMTPNILSSFVVTVDCASDDDSDWDTCETEQCNSSSIVKNCNSNKLSPIWAKTKSREIKSSRPVDCDSQKVTNFISSFIVPVESCSDDESDWDTCETEILNGIAEFELTGLLVTSLCTPLTLSSDANHSIDSSGEDDETIKLRVHLQEVNKKWNESTQGIEVTPKLPSKVSFAPDEALTKVFPVDICERKGEWEIYATERLRFKRKIDELEKILSPCFNPEHRSKIFKKLNESVL